MNKPVEQCSPRIANNTNYHFICNAHIAWHGYCMLQVGLFVDVFN